MYHTHPRNWKWRLAQLVRRWIFLKSPKLGVMVPIHINSKRKTKETTKRVTYGNCFTQSITYQLKKYFKNLPKNLFQPTWKTSFKGKYLSEQLITTKEHSGTFPRSAYKLNKTEFNFEPMSNLTRFAIFFQECDNAIHLFNDWSPSIFRNIIMISLCTIHFSQNIALHTLVEETGYCHV